MRKSTILLSFLLLCASTALRADPAPVEDLSQPRELERPNYYGQDDGDYDDDADTNDNANQSARANEYSDNQRDQRPQVRRDQTVNRTGWSGQNNVAENRNTGLSIDQRLAKLEQQIDNATKLNLLGRIEELQDEIGQLRGQLDKQTHDLQMLTLQQKQFYQDLSARIIQSGTKAQVAQQTASSTQPAQVAQKTESVSAQESQSYREGFDALKSKQYDRAITAFQRYLVRYPAGHYAVNANYWLGEIYYLQGKSLEAKKAFTSVVKNYPASQKMPDALLKLAIIEIDAGNKSEGQRILEQVQQQYPGTTAARLAALRYQELRLSS